MSQLWVLSTNKPSQTMITLGVLIVILAFFSGLLNWVMSWLFGWMLPIFFELIYSWISWFWIAFGIYYLFQTVFLYHESRTIHYDPFPDGSVCSFQPDRLAYDRCALCGCLACPDELIRIQQSLTSPFGMFGFDGVACQECAQRRAKRTPIVSLVVSAILFPLALIPLVSIMQIIPSNLGTIVVTVLVIILSIIVVFGVWNWQRFFRKVSTSLSEQPERMISIKERLAEKGIIGQETVFRKIGSRN